MSKRIMASVATLFVFVLMASCGKAGPTGAGASPSEAAAGGDASLCAETIPSLTKTAVRVHVEQGINVGLVVGVVTPCGREFYAEGTTELAGSTPVDENTVFEIGSIGKVFTTLLLADMVEQGEVSLDDPIEKFLPEDVVTPTYNGQSIRLVDLATHTSGLPVIPDNLSPADEYRPYADYTVEQMYDELAHTKLTRDIGSEYSYSNLGMGVLGHVLSLESGMSYEDLVITRITDVLGMPNTRATLTLEMLDHLATGYREDQVFPLWDNPTLAGAGALRSTADDLLTFVAANMGLTSSRLDAAIQLSEEPRFTIDESTEIGLGWHILVDGENPIYEHNGATGGYWSFVGFDREKQIGVVVLTNSFEDISAIGLNLLRTAPSYATP